MNIKIAKTTKTKTNRWTLGLGLAAIFILAGLGLGFSSSAFASEPVGQVKDVKVKEITNNQVKLKWDQVDQAEKYQIRVTRKVNGEYKLVKKVKTTKTNKVVDELKANRIYYFKVRAYNNGAYGEYSSRTSAETTVGKVKDVNSTEITDTSIDLQWTSVDGAEQYEVRVMTQNGDTYDLLKKEETTATNLEISDLSPEQTYYFSARAQKGGVYGPYSGRISVTTLAEPELEFWNGGTTLPGYARAAVSGTLSTENSAGRTGSYYLPAGYNTEAKPLLVLYHGTNGDGAQILNWFIAYAAANDFIIVAPDSRKSPSGDYIWEVGVTEGELTEDYTHTLNCISEVDNIAGVSFDSAHVMTAGFSAGGSSAPYISTNDGRFTHYAILHGGVFTGGLGDNIIPGWLSTGDTDTLRTTEMYEGYYDELEAAGFTDLTYNVYTEGHEINSDERSELIYWWLY